MRWGGFSSSLSSSSSSLSSSSSSLSSSSSSSSSATTRDNWQQRHHYPATSEQQQVQAAQVTSLKCNYCQKPFTSLRGYTYHLERAVCQKGKGSQQGAAAAAAIANADAESLEETSADTYSTAGDAKISPAADDAKTKNDKQPLLRDAVGGDRDDRDDPVSMSTNTATTTKAIMNRPYLRRTLLYCRDPLDKNYFPLWKDRQRSAEVGQELPQLDILAQLFGHDEPQEYNAALLDDENTWQYYQRVGGTNIVGNDDDKNGSNASSDGASMNSSEENRDVSVMKTPPPRKRKRRITPTTTPASKSAKQNRAGRRLPSRPESDGSGCGNEVSSPSSSTSSTSSSSSSRQHTKLFFDVQMAQSPSKVLSPTTAEMKYGKAFPPYQPRDQTTGKWIPPQKPRSAYELFADSTRGQARLHLKRRDRNNQVRGRTNSHGANASMVKAHLTPFFYCMDVLTPHNQNQINSGKSRRAVGETLGQWQYDDRSVLEARRGMGPAEISVREGDLYACTAVGGQLRQSGRRQQWQERRAPLVGNYFQSNLYDCTKASCECVLSLFLPPKRSADGSN